MQGFLKYPWRIRGSRGVVAQRWSTRQDPTSEPQRLETVILAEGLNFCMDVLE
jgi:hypothetical protein